MYLTRIELDTARRSTMRALIMPNLLHGAVESSFLGERRRNLWRIDTLSGRTYLMLLSEEKPDLSAVKQQFGVVGGSDWETKDYVPLLNRIEQGSTWAFRLVANPTKSSSRPASATGNSRGTVHAHATVAYQEAWLEERAQRYGFTLKQDDFRVVHSQWYRFCKGADRRNILTILSVTYEGILTVTDENLFRQTMTEGIGRGKAYGMGLLTVVHPMGNKYE